MIARLLRCQDPMSPAAGPPPNRKGRRSARSVPRAVLHQGMFAAANGSFSASSGTNPLSSCRPFLFLDLVPSGRRPEVKRHLLRAEETGAADSVDIPLRTTEGDTVAALMRCNRVRFNGESCIEVVLSPAVASARTGPEGQAGPVSASRVSAGVNVRMGFRTRRLRWLHRRPRSSLFVRTSQRRRLPGRPSVTRSPGETVSRRSATLSSITIVPC